MRFATLSFLLILAVALAGCAAAQDSNTQAQATSAAWATQLAPTDMGAYPAATQPANAYPSSDMAPTTYPQPQSGDPGAQPAQPTPDMPAGAVIVFHRSGGVAGLNQTWTVYGDGRVVDQDGKETKSDPAAVATALAAVRAAGFFEMKAQYGQNACCDRFAYTLTVRDGDQQHSVTWFDGEEAPPALETFMPLITALIGQ